MDFLSHAAIVGFVAGAAIVIGLQQLKGLLGITHFTTKTDIISVLEAVWRSVHHHVYIYISFSFSFSFRGKGLESIYSQSTMSERNVRICSHLNRSLIYSLCFFDCSGILIILSLGPHS